MIGVALLMVTGPARPGSRAAADTRAADGAGAAIRLRFECGDLQPHAAHLCQPLLEPDVGLPHRLAVPGQVLGLALLDQLLGGGKLPADLGQVGLVGGEVVAAVAGFSELTV